MNGWPRFLVTLQESSRILWSGRLLFCCFNQFYNQRQNNHQDYQHDLHFFKRTHKLSLLSITFNESEGSGPPEKANRPPFMVTP